LGTAGVQVPLLPYPQTPPPRQSPHPLHYSTLNSPETLVILAEVTLVQSVKQRGSSSCVTCQVIEIGLRNFLNSHSPDFLSTSLLYRCHPSVLCLLPLLDKFSVREMWWASLKAWKKQSHVRSIRRCIANSRCTLEGREGKEGGSIPTLSRVAVAAAAISLAVLLRLILSWKHEYSGEPPLMPPTQAVDHRRIPESVKFRRC